MKIYQYYFRDCADGDIEIVEGVDLYDVNKRAYALYEEWFGNNDVDYWNKPKLTFVEFCRYYAQHNYGGVIIADGCDIYRHDFEVNVC